MVVHQKQKKKLSRGFLNSLVTFLEIKQGLVSHELTANLSIFFQFKLNEL